MKIWNICENNFDISKNTHYEGVFTTGNGYLSIRGSIEEGFEDDLQDDEYWRLPTNVTLEKPRKRKSKWGTYIPGITGYHPLLKEVMVNLPWPLEFKLWVDDERLDMESCDIIDYCRYLDLRYGTLHRNFIWKTKSGIKMQVYFQRFISMADDHLGVQKITLKILSGEGQIRVESGINGNVRTNGYNHFKKIQSDVLEDRYISLEVLTDKGDTVVEGCSLYSSCFDKWKIEHESGRVYYHGCFQVETGQVINFLKLSAIATDRDLENMAPHSLVTEMLKKNEGVDYQALYQRHCKVWDSKWEQSDIRIEGNQDIQQALRFSVYHLIRSNASKDPRVAICAKGHAGEAYFGRYFWDTEIYLLPFFIYTQPEAAKNLIMFRYNTLEGARRNAALYGYKGARYAWESSVTGDEQCPNWQYADHEVHVTADVVYGLWHYYKATDDFSFLKDYGIEMLLETSRYWIHRVDRNISGGYDLMGVMGPDEYTVFSCNNAYTNKLVKFNLKKTLEALMLIRAKEPKSYQEISQRLKVTEEELRIFRDIAEKLPIPKDSEQNLVLQSEDFPKYVDLDFKALWKDRSKPFGFFVSQEKRYRSKCLKQADVLALMMLFPHEFTVEQISNAYEYYEPITTHDSSLSPSTHAIIAAWLGRIEEANAFFNKSAHIDLDETSLGAAEGIHIANAGGNWQIIVHGFMGIRNVLQSDKLQVSPMIPDSFKRVSLNLIWKGIPTHIEVSNNEVKIYNRGQKPLEAIVWGRTMILSPGEECTINK